MDKRIIRNLEGFLSGELGAAANRDLKAHLQTQPRTKTEVDRMAEIAGLFDTLAVPEEAAGPSPGFAARVTRRIEQQRASSFWDFLQQPVFLRRVAVASCGWLLLLLSASAYRSSALPPVDHSAQAILAAPAPSPAYCGVRLGCDLDRNRDTMLVAVMISGRMGP